MYTTRIRQLVCVLAAGLVVIVAASVENACAQTVIGQQWWQWDADVNPLTQNDNGDALPDFKERHDNPFNLAELTTADGRTVWQRVGDWQATIDTNPSGLVGDAQAIVIGRATGPSNPDSGIAWWLNFDQTKEVGEPDGMAAVSVFISLDAASNTQWVTWFENDVPNYRVQLDQVTGLPADMFLELDIQYDTVADQITYDVLDAATDLSLIGGTRTFGYDLTTVNADEFATILVWPGGSAAGQVDFVSLQADLISLEAIPEPSSGVLALVGMLGVFLVVRRRRITPRR
jgi:hypothetical protein